MFLYVGLRKSCKQQQLRPPEPVQGTRVDVLICSLCGGTYDQTSFLHALFILNFHEEHYWAFSSFSTAVMNSGFRLPASSKNVLAVDNAHLCITLTVRARLIDCLADDRVSDATRVS